MSKQSVLRGRVERVLKSPACFAVRFKMENVHIQTYMYVYIAGAILQDNYVRLEIGDDQGFGPDPYPHITFPHSDIPERNIVHEATHAVIYATHKGQRMTFGTNEVAAFLAESIYGEYAKQSMGPDFPPYFGRAFKDLAGRIVKWNSDHPGGESYPCDPSEVADLKKLLGAVGYAGMDKVDTMKGIGD